MHYLQIEKEMENEDVALHDELVQALKSYMELMLPMNIFIEEEEDEGEEDFHLHGDSQPMIG